MLCILVVNLDTGMQYYSARQGTVLHCPVPHCFSFFWDVPSVCRRINNNGVPVPGSW